MPPTGLVEPDVLAAAGARKRVREAAAANGCERVFIVADENVAGKTPVVKDVEHALGDLYVGSHVGIGQHAPAESVQAATVGAHAAKADAIVTIGGGSVQDAGKFVRFQLSGMLAKDPIVQIAIPTTLSGAEFTYLAGWTVPDKDGKQVKSGIADAALVPDAVLMDPEACAYTPRWLWASAGIRAVDHACEGITSGAAAPEVQERCLAALRLLKENLPKSTADAADLSAAEACLRASHAASAGINYGGAGAGLSHKLGKALGATWSIPHGVTSAITLPAVLAAEHQVRPERTKLIADALGARSAADGVRALIDACKVEHKPLAEYGVTPQDLPRIVTYALGRRDAMVEALVLNLL